MTSLKDTLHLPEPEPGLSPPRQALWWLAKGGFSLGAEWERAHEICQMAEGTRDYDLAHALAHTIEGDHGNAAYWYRRSGVAKVSDDVQAEWAAIADVVG